MKISLNWLRDYIKTEEGPDEIARLLTGTGLEVESLEKVEPIKGGLKGVVIGEVITCQKHPEADRLSLTTVNTGTEIVPIVCGAPNVAQGQKVLVATVGATLYPLSGEPFQIKKAKIRGQESYGMICAEDELGLGTSHDGIMVLDNNAPVGMAASAYYEIQEDYCIEIGLTPNRIDAASHMGVARDLAAVLSHNHQNRFQISRPPVNHFKADENTSPVTITIQDPSACPRYTGVSLTGVKVEESPAWLKNRLRTLGLKPINNVVDITNYVLHETGQPLHAFDASTITGNRIIVRKPERDTPFVTLDETEVKLNGNDLMICNEKEPMCMAGILGGMDAGVNQNTTSIFLESAYFEPSGIRKSSKYHGINTDSSFRFERGADPQMTVYALKRAALLIKEIAGGKITSEVLDVYPNPVVPSRINFLYETADRLIGKQIPQNVIKNILASLDFTFLEESQQALLLEVPPYRVDVTREADVVEELLRIYGYNNVELPGNLHSSIVASPKPDKEKLQNIASDFLSSRGFNEIMNNSLSRASYYQNEMFRAASVVNILNPLSQDLGVMRQTLFFGGMETIAWNQNRKVQDLKIYEFGNVYFKEDSAQKEDSLKLPGYREQRMLAVFITGNFQSESWYRKQNTATLFDLKAEVLELLVRMNIPVKEAVMEEIHKEAYWEAGLRYKVKEQVLFELGEVTRSLLKAFDVKQDVFYAAINWELALQLQNSQPIRYREISKYPEVRRDLALLINKDVKFSDIEKIAFTTERKILKKVILFDVYRDEKMSPGMKSYAVGFTLLDENKTLTDKDIDKSMERIAGALQKELNATIRK